MIKKNLTHSTQILNSTSAFHKSNYLLFLNRFICVQEESIHLESFLINQICIS